MGPDNSEGHAELSRLLKRAIRHLESTNLSGANEALKKAGERAALLGRPLEYRTVAGKGEKTENTGDRA